MAIVFVGIDLAKNVFAVHGIDEHGKTALVRPAVPRAKLHEFVAALPPCTVAMEACTGAHHWARLFASHGHAVRLIAPKFVAPYVFRLSRLKAKPSLLARRKNGWLSSLQVMLHLRALVLLLDFAQALLFGNGRGFDGRRSALQHTIANLLAPLAPQEGVDAQRLGPVLDEHTGLVAQLDRLQLQLDAVAIDRLSPWGSHSTLPSSGESGNET